jgi:hypothetical protein
MSPLKFFKICYGILAVGRKILLQGIWDAFSLSKAYTKGRRVKLNNK